LLAARVPSRPEVSHGIGLDAVTWAKLGIIDHLTVSPFWATTDFDIPVEEWRRLIEGADVTLTAGLEIRVQPYPGSPTLENTTERMRGVAIAALARGGVSFSSQHLISDENKSDGIYLFNYMGLQQSKPFLFKELGSIGTLQGKNRSHVITYVDIEILRQPIPHALPKKLAPSASAEFRLHIGPKPEGATGQVLLPSASKDRQNHPHLRLRSTATPLSSNPRRKITHTRTNSMGTILEQVTTLSK